MIVLSDEDDEVEVTSSSSDEKMGKVSSPRAKENQPVVDTDDTDDVCVVGEVTPFVKKFPRGVVLGPARPHEVHGLHIANLRRRKRTETNSIVKYGTIRRNISGSSTFRSMCSSAMVRRKLFSVGEAVRLEERRKYLQLIQAIIGYEMVTASYKILLTNFLHFFAPYIWRALQYSQPLRVPPSVQAPAPFARCTVRTKPPTVQCVDLDSELDSDNDIVELPQRSQTSKESVQTKHDDDDDEIAAKDDVIDLEQEPENPSSTLQASFEQEDEEIELQACTSSAQSKQTPDEDDTYINLVDDEEEEEDDSDSVTAVSYPAENKSKGNLSDQMIQQMIIHDEHHIPIEIEKPDDDEQTSEDDSEESLPEITFQMQVLVHKAFRSKLQEVLVNAFSLTVCGRDIQTLKGNNWLNDQVINFYMSLIMERGKLKSYPSVYCFNTFFFVKLVSSGHASLRRWTRTVDLFSYDMLIIPVHLKVHWCLAAINFIEKKIEYYDSMRDNNDNSNYGQVLLKYLQDEHLDKKKKEFNTAGWEVVNMKDIPEQMNGCDCGVFACTYAEYICRLAKLTFTQQHMPYFRVKMVYEIITKKLLL